MMAAAAGAALALGIIIVLRGLFPARPNLASRLADFNEDELVAPPSGKSLVTNFAVTLFQTVKGDDMKQIRCDLDVIGMSIEDAAMERFKGALGGAALAMVMGSRVGAFSSVIGLLLLAVVFGALGYMIPDFELSKKADERREEFTRALTAFVTLVGSSISGGGGLTTALNDAAAMGDGWVFSKIRDALDDAKLAGTSSWAALDKLGRDLQVTALIELSGSLTMAGSSGARVTETLSSRAESARAKEISDTRAAAEAKSSSLGMPVGLMLLAWFVFMAFPGIAGMMSGL